MSAEARPNVGVLGLGNLIRSDDGVGIHAVRRLLESGRLPPSVQVTEGGTLGLDLLPRIDGLTHVLALDAVESGAPPGALSRFANQDLLTLPVGKSVHLLGFNDLLNALRLLGRFPDKVVLLGIQPESTDWGITLSPRVAAALDSLLEEARSEIVEWLDIEPAAIDA